MKGGFRCTVKNRQELCKCLPEWLSNFAKRPFDNQCSFCSAPFEDEEQIRFGQTIMYRCSQSPVRVHSFGIRLHSQCTTNYELELQKKNRIATIDIIPISLENIPKDQIRKFSAECLRRHKITSISCGYCKTREPEGSSMKICSGCKMARYCDDECQALDWKAHKEFCKAKQRGMKNAKEKSGRFKRTPCCSCFTAYETAIANHLDRGICSNPKCSVPVDGPVSFSVYMGTCSAIAGKLVPHLIPLAYCSSHCQKTGPKQNTI